MNFIISYILTFINFGLLEIELPESGEESLMEVPDNADDSEMIAEALTDLFNREEDDDTPMIKAYRVKDFENHRRGAHHGHHH